MGFLGGRIGFRHVDACVFATKLGSLGQSSSVLSRQRKSRLPGSLLIQVDASVDHRTTTAVTSGLGTERWSRPGPEIRPGGDARAPRTANHSRLLPGGPSHPAPCIEAAWKAGKGSGGPNVIVRRSQTPAVLFQSPPDRPTHGIEGTNTRGYVLNCSWRSAPRSRRSPLVGACSC